MSAMKVVSQQQVSVKAHVLVSETYVESSPFPPNRPPPRGIPKRLGPTTPRVNGLVEVAVETKDMPRKRVAKILIILFVYSKVNGKGNKKIVWVWKL